ncbi:MAG: T9SS type A sorting domain-containing protein [Saprospiraceae bacterium]|nr:T9SS type A sorting domain-containing protein [Saprospiraceae bacterium]
MAFETNNLTSGIYILEFKTRSLTATKKIVIAK